MTTKEERIEQDGLSEEPILFYSGRGEGFECFSNFSAHSLFIPSPWTGEIHWYKTGEHRYQAMKAVCQEDHDLVASSPSPRVAKTNGRNIELREDWGDLYGDLCYQVMLEVVMAKALQNEAVYHALMLESDGRAIWEDSPYDASWGIRKGDDYSGSNLLGRAWMHTREVLNNMDI